MPLFGEYAGPEFGLNDVKIATNTAGVYGSAVDVPSVQMYEVNPQTVNAQLEGDDKITDTHAIAISAQVRIRFGSVSLEALEVLLGKTAVESGSGTTEVKTIRIDNLKFPYFGICGKANSTQDGGDTHLYVPKCKIMEGFTLGMQYGQYVIPEITCTAVADENGIIMDIVKHETAVSVTIPPVYT